MIKKIFIFFKIILLAILAIVFIFYWSVFLPKEPLSEKKVFFTIERGQGSKDIALNLERENLIKSALFFRAYIFLKGISGNLKAGDYYLSPSMNITEVADKIFRGDVVKEKITIIEGWSSREIAFYFEEKGLFNEKDFKKTIEKDFSEEFDFLKDKPADLNLEGYLFPDTYEIVKNEELSDVIKKMLANFDKKLTLELREEIASQNKSIFEIVIMASLIEKEVRALEDKKMVSGILWKRLDINMPLQVDATIAYILEAERWTFDQMRREIGLARQIDSKYNTYKYRGLPMGPISNPGIESIVAAIRPKENNYFYYLSTPEGETIFSRTLEEHNQAKAKYF